MWPRYVEVPAKWINRVVDFARAAGTMWVMARIFSVSKLEDEVQRAGISRRSFCRFVGFDYSAWQAWHRGGGLQLSTAVAIVDALGIDLDDLLEEVPDAPPGGKHASGPRVRRPHQKPERRQRTD